MRGFWNKEEPGKDKRLTNEDFLNLKRSNMMSRMSGSWEELQLSQSGGSREGGGGEERNRSLRLLVMISVAAGYPYEPQAWT